MENEIPRYRKKVNKTVNKSKHKHEYVDCLFYELSTKYYYKGTYCKVCGKIGTFGIESKKSDDGRSQMLSQNELLVKYKDVAVKEVTSLFKVKHVAL